MFRTVGIVKHWAGFWKSQGGDTTIDERGYLPTAGRHNVAARANILSAIRRREPDRFHAGQRDQFIAVIRSSPSPVRRVAPEEFPSARC